MAKKTTLEYILIRNVGFGSIVGLIKLKNRLKENELICLRYCRNHNFILV